MVYEQTVVVVATAVMLHIAGALLQYVSAAAAVAVA